MSKFTRQFNSPSGNWIRFSIRKNKFLVDWGQGRERKRRDKFPLNAARQMAYEILELTGEYQRAHQGDQRVQKAFAGKEQFSPDEIRTAVIEVMKQAPDTGKFGEIKKVINGDGVVMDVSEKDIEKMKEQVIEDIYGKFGREWFVASDFVELYNDNYDRGDARVCLHRLKNSRWLNSDDDIPEDMDVSPYTQYRYRLSKMAVELVEKQGGLTSDSNPAWRMKRQMLPEKHRPTT